MRAQGNSDPQVCAANLLRTVRGEVPYARTKGIDGSLIDRPASSPEVAEDIEWVIEEYEPRLAFEDVLPDEGAGAAIGDFAYGFEAAGGEEDGWTL